VTGEELDDPAHVGGVEAALVQGHVLARLQGGDDGGVGGRTADAVLFQGATRLASLKARRRLGEMLFGADLVQLDPVALFQRRQQFFVAVGLASASSRPRGRRT
jgi:hypothetical protein